MPYANKIKKTIKNLEKLTENQDLDFKEEITSLEKKLQQIQKRRTGELEDVKKHHTPWERVKMARMLERPKPQDYIAHIIKDFTELHGDRNFGNDNAIIGGIGFLEDLPVTCIATRRGKEIHENMRSNFGMPHPEGYRKALRLVKQAEKFNRPVIFFVDTPGAYPGIGAEERGISEAIARNLYELSDLEVPSLTVITGEGGSGGALGLAVANKIYMMQNSVLSVISPEGCASILFKDPSKAPQAAESLRLTAFDLYELGIIDQVIEENEDFDEKPGKTYKRVEKILYKDLTELMLIDKEKLAKQRYNKYRNIGFFDTGNPLQSSSIPTEKSNSFMNQLTRFLGIK
ncbi:MAG: acetyl-CoA carboxylase carboxyltransferase subunit alpha [Bacteroidales bacterium]